ncbi:hypothetical protein KDW_23710 [Dictyobacter vulcani]|uniref:Uncharacterized protein n=1 Tax=Dictyobacter vulcani TaxID=2607529 RepID=A0A5J4KQ15_9CHLR|nr:hypothetical protein [Dictyobacter vulcani]GER88209.1 hypothetical protein KDW_23710 [Dictyobacter vulcani]
MEETTGRKWYWRILDFINPLRDPSLTVAAVLTFIEEAGQHNPWYIILVIALVNWLAVRGIVWLVVNFTFAAVFVGRRVWWSMKHPHLAWRILDAVGHEEIVIGGNSGMSDSIMLQDGTTIMSPLLGANGIHVIGELPAGTELPMLGMPGGQMPQDGMQPFNGSGFFPGAHDFSPNGFPGQPAMNYQPAGNNTYNNEFVSPQSTDGLQQNFSQRPSEEEEQLRQQVAAFNRLLEDWIQFTEEKWRTISDSQLGWKPLRGRWGNWDDIFQDAYAAKTSDPMAEAAQSAGEATARRYETSKEKGSAASAVACFMRDMMTLRRGLDMIQQTPEQSPNASQGQPTSQQNKQFGSNNNSGSLFNNNSTGNTAARSTLIRRPAQIFVDADSKK